MFERFTPRARQAVVLAQEEARGLDHTYIGTEHLLLGLVHEGTGVAAVALRSFGLGLDVVRAEVEALVGRGDGASPGHIPFTSRSKKVLELSLREAIGLGHNYIGTEHVLLGIVRESDGAAAQLLRNRGVDADAIRSAVLAALNQVVVARGQAPTSAPGRRTRGADDIIAAAHQLAGNAPMGSQHLLLAMSLLDDSLASGALSSLGIERDALTDIIAGLDLEQTSDLTPEDAAARKMEVRLVDNEVHIVLRDPAAVEEVRSLTEQMGNPILGTDAIGSPLVELWEATIGALRSLTARVRPEPAEEPATDSKSVSAIVRAAIRDRLHRR